MPDEKMPKILALFKEHDKDYVRGGFGHISEKVLLAWNGEKNLYHWKDENNQINFAAYGTRVKQRRAIKDFSGRTIAHMKPGDVHFKRLAYRNPDNIDTLREIADLHFPGHGRIWAEDFIEYDGRTTGRFHRVCTKIRGDSTMIGVYVSERAPSISRTSMADEVTLQRLNLPVPKNLVVDARLAMRREGIEWADHYSHYNVAHTWSAVTLRGYGGRSDFIIKPSEMSRKWKDENSEKLEWVVEDAPMRSRLSEVEALIDLVPGVKHRIRLMRLKAKSELLRHADITDPDAGIRDGELLRIHIPLITNDGCTVTQWLLGGEERNRHMAVGEVWYLDTRKPHAVKNEGETDRVHLVMDVESCPDLRALLGIQEQEPPMEKWI